MKSKANTVAAIAVCLAALIGRPDRCLKDRGSLASSAYENQTHSNAE